MIFVSASTDDPFVTPLIVAFATHTTSQHHHITTSQYQLVTSQENNLLPVCQRNCCADDQWINSEKNYLQKDKMCEITLQTVVYTCFIGLVHQELFRFRSENRIFASIFVHQQKIEYRNCVKGNAFVTPLLWCNNNAANRRPVRFAHNLMHNITSTMSMSIINL